MRNKTCSVTELNGIVKALLDSEPLLNEVSVTGELSNYKIYPSGHHYFTLKDKDSALRCVMFKGYTGRLRFKPESGISVVARGSVNVYLRDGTYQLNVTALERAGVGDLQAEFERLRAKLEAEGLFDARHKKSLPRFPKRIAVITSSAGAAIHDIIRILGVRYPAAEVILLPVRVQGIEAPPEITGAIRYANLHSVADLIITGRGGGSIEDLWAFNDERVVRAIFESRIPVISAVGHEPDVTLSDYVADVRASTPSNAAELAVPDQGELRDALSSFELRCAAAIRQQMSRLRSRFDELASRRVLRDPNSYTDMKRMALDFARQRFADSAARYLGSRRESLIGLTASLDALSPLSVLARGYSVAQDGDGNAVRSVSGLQSGDPLTLLLSDGSLSCTVDEVRPSHDDKFTTGGRPDA